MNFKGNYIFKVVRFLKQKMLFVILTGALPSLAQLNPRNLTQYTELDGLPASEVGSILPDRNGYIWIGTLNGLARYDGYEFKRFFNNPNDPGSIKGLQVGALYEDRKGRIWISASPENLNAYDHVTRSFRSYEYKHLIEHAANIELVVTAICEDHKGRIYFGVNTNYGNHIHSSILFMDDGDSAIHPFEIKDTVFSQNVVSMTSDQQGNIWIITFSGLHKIDTLHQWNTLPEPGPLFEKTGDFPVDMKFSNDGNLWIISFKSILYEFDPKSNKLQKYSPIGPLTESYGNTLAIDRLGNIWIGNSRGLSVLHRNTKEFELLNAEVKLPPDRSQINVIKPDDFGNIWVGTYALGLFKYEEKAIFTSFGYKNDAKNSLTAGWANNIYEARDGRIYIATSELPANSGLNILDPEAQSITRIFTYAQIAIDGVLGLIEYAPNEFYLSTWGGIYQFSMADNKVKKIDLEGIPDTLLIQKFFEDKKGNLWAGTNKGLYRKTIGGSGFTKYDLSLKGLGNASSNEILNFVESPKHGLWLLTNNGLFLYNYETDKIERHGYDRAQGDIFITQDINSFYEDSSGLAWVGTWQGGLSYYNVDTKKIEAYTLDDGLPSMSIQSILADENKGTLWLSTFDGLSRFDLKAKKFYNYSISDGIQGQLFADGAALKTSKGFFIFGGSNGITLFKPDQIKESSHPPRVFLTNLKLFDQIILPGENNLLKKPIQEIREITLKNDQNNITLEFAAIHYSNPSKNRVLYQLEGYENEWRDAGSQHLAFYPALSPGQYNFRVKAANNNGVWNEEGASLKITILPPWWKTTWAYLGYFILLVAGGFTLDKYLRHRIVEKERERFQAKQLEQAKEIEQAYIDLGQAHESLKSTQAQLIHSEKMASLGELTAGIAHEIQNPLNFVNNFSEVNSELIAEMNEEIKKANYEEVQHIANNITENEQKINFHGKRADAIVKSMLQHSRNATGQKELIDLNALCDEYLRLSYHGLKAKDKTFQAEFSVDLDPDLPKIAVVPQEIGRVFLNLFNNAFYAVGERMRTESPERSLGAVTTKYNSLGQTERYKPAVKASTRWIKAVPVNLAEIRIEDNGPGIPEEIRDKIFQPFYTTKATGEGTGLGLSLAYDIVKAHNGEIIVKSKESEGTVFIIQLPVL